MSRTPSEPNESNLEALRAARRRLLGAFWVVTAMLVGHRALAQFELLTPYEYFGSRRLLAVRGLQAALLLGAMVLIVRAPRRRWGRGIEPAVWGLTLVLAGIGGYATALRADLIKRDVASLESFCETIGKSTDPMLGRGRIDELTAKVAELEGQGDVDAIIETRRTLSTHLLRHNDIAPAQEQLLLALRAAQKAEYPLEQVNGLRTELAVAALRGGEVTHCLHGHNPDSCLFPIQKEGVWANPEAGRTAIKWLMEVLEADPDDVRARWLLNVAAMAVGIYPEGVDERFVLPPERLKPDRDMAGFTELAGEKGMDDFNVIGGAIMDDFDGDGRLDIVSSSYDSCSTMHFYRNEGDGTFADWADQSGISKQLGGFNLMHADYDNDGDLDIYVVRGAWQLHAPGRQRNSLLQNDGKGNFTDVSFEAGLALRAYPAQAAAWGDYDNDGFVDLYVGNEWYPSQLFHNEGDGTFVDVAHEAGVENVWGLPGPPNTKGATFGDYDNDGDLDLYVSNLNQPNHLYRNEGNGSFVDVAPDLGVDLERGQGVHSFTSWFFDANQDGNLDLFVGGYPPAKLEVWAADFLGFPGPDNMEDQERLQIYINDGNGGFTDATKDMELFDVRFPMGANYGDIDSDGFPDIYLGTGSPPFEILVPNVMYRNDGGKRFENVTSAVNMGHLQKGHAVAFGDLDGDGDQDVFIQMGGWYKADAFYNALFENPGYGNHWLTVRLVGDTTNRAAIGARVRVRVLDGGQSRDVYTWVSSGASFGANSLQQEIGLGGGSEIEELEITWPTSGTVQRVEGVKVDSAITVTEGVDGFVALGS
ncbi:MAG: FG-GAP-like repeat-containing protein [Myxococcota bacterium]